MPGGDPALPAPLEHGMGGDQRVALVDAHLAGEHLHLDRAPAGQLGHRILVAVHGDHALAGDAPVQPQHRLERPGRQRLEARPLLGEVLGDDAPRGGVGARVGDIVQPLPELGVEVVEVAEAAGEEEVLADVAERALDLTLGLGPIGPARLGQEAVVARQLEQGRVEQDDAVGVLAADHGAHAVVEDLARHAAQRLEGRRVAAQHGLQVLVRDEARPDQPAVA